MESTDYPRFKATRLHRLEIFLFIKYQLLTNHTFNFLSLRSRRYYLLFFPNFQGSVCVSSLFLSIAQPVEVSNSLIFMDLWVYLLFFPDLYKFSISSQTRSNRLIFMDVYICCSLLFPLWVFKVCVCLVLLRGFQGYKLIASTYEGFGFGKRGILGQEKQSRLNLANELES